LTSELPFLSKKLLYDRNKRLYILLLLILLFISDIKRNSLWEKEMLFLYIMLLTMIMMFLFLLLLSSLLILIFFSLVALKNKSATHMRFLAVRHFISDSDLCGNISNSRALSLMYIFWHQLDISMFLFFFLHRKKEEKYLCHS
jgi:hypothetical protein